MTLNEFSKLFETNFIFSKKFKSNLALNLFRKKDINKSGFINFDQFKSLIQEIQTLLEYFISSDPNDLRKIFSQFISGNHGNMDKTGRIKFSKSNFNLIALNLKFFF